MQVRGHRRCQTCHPAILLQKEVRSESMAAVAIEEGSVFVVRDYRHEAIPDRPICGEFFVDDLEKALAPQREAGA